MVKKKISEDFAVVVDTREQKPYRFPRSVVSQLVTGDYSIVGLEDRITVERKSKEDAYNSLGQGRERFERELERLAKFDYAAIVIESTVEGFLDPPPFSRMSPIAAINSILAWSVKYRLFVFFAGDWRHGNALTYRLLEKYWRYREREEGDRKA